MSHLYCQTSILIQRSGSFVYYHLLYFCPQQVVSICNLRKYQLYDQNHAGCSLLSACSTSLFSGNARHSFHQVEVPALYQLLKSPSLTHLDVPTGIKFQIFHRCNSGHPCFYLPPKASLHSCTSIPKMANRWVESSGFSFGGKQQLISKVS